MGYISEDQKHSVANLYAHFMKGKIQFKVFFSANKCYFFCRKYKKTLKNINHRKVVNLTLKKSLHDMCKKVVPLK
jgi:hypothetical protein